MEIEFNRKRKLDVFIVNDNEIPTISKKWKSAFTDERQTYRTGKGRKTLQADGKHRLTLDEPLNLQIEVWKRKLLNESDDDDDIELNDNI